MITKYRNRSILQAICALVLSVLLVIVFRKSIHVRTSHDWFVLALVLYFATWAMWVMTSLSLARAKGYSRDLAGTLFLIFIIVGFCVPIALVAFPFYIIFAMEDKTKGRTRRR
jgi:ABC-type phosphate transport system permease subunit